MKLERHLASTPIALPSGPRAGALVAIPAFAVADGIDARVPNAAWLDGLSAVAPITWVVVIAAIIATLGQGWLLLRLSSQTTGVWRRVNALEASIAGSVRSTVLASSRTLATPWIGLPEGAPAPPFRLAGLYGEVLTLDALRAVGNPVLLVFADMERGGSRRLASRAGEWQREHVDQLTVVLVGRKTTDLDRLGAAEALPARVLLQEDFEVSRQFRVERLPSAVLVGGDGAIGSTVVVGEEAIRDLVELTSVATGGRPPVSNSADALDVMLAADDGASDCDACVRECLDRGGGSSCRPVCELGGSCATT